jgi:hypothetical protein
MGNANKYADGLEYLLFPGNMGFGACGYNYPESTAQDLDGGAISLSFSGSTRPYGGKIADFRYGPSGYYAGWITMAVLTGGTIARFNNSSLTGAERDALQLGTPDLRSLFGVSAIYATETGYYPQSFKNQRAYNSINQINVLDLVSEGPIEGFVSGIYIPNLSGKTTGDIGFTSVSFQPFATTFSSPETRSIYYDDVPITDYRGYYNFQFVDYKYTYGEKTNDHTIYNPYLNLYENRRNYFGRQVDINKIPIETSVTRSIGDKLYGAYTAYTGNRAAEGNLATTAILNPKRYYVYNTDVSALKVNVQINSLYEQILTGSNAGDVERQNITLEYIIYRVLKNGEVVILDTSKYYPYITNYYSNDNVELKGKITNPLIITYEISLRPFAENSPWFELFPNQIGWAIDVVKLVYEAVGGTISNSTDVHSITEVYSDRFVYPDAALVLSRFDARYFSSVPTRTFKLRLLKVKIPTNYDPIARSYSGAWNGQFKVAWTDNPAWCFYDLITNNRFGLGRYINSDLTDKWSLYEIAQYCDQLVADGAGGLEPRFRCNLYIANKEEAYKVLNDMASLFNAIVYYSAGQITVAQDSLKEPIYIFNNSNVVNGLFNYSDSSRKARRTVAYVRYNNENDNYKPAIEYIEDKDSILRYGIRETDITAFGCTTKNQARRAGKWLLTTENSETELIDFQVGLDGNYIRPGDIISVYDQYRKNQIYAGRTLELNSGNAVLDLPYNSYNLYAITGVNSSFRFDVLVPTYNLNFGTYLGDLYETGFNVTSSGVTGLNSSFIRKSQIQSIDFNTNLSNYVSSGTGLYSNNIKLTFPTTLNAPYGLVQNTVWSIDLSVTGYGGISGGLDIRSPINNTLRQVYPGYYLEPYLNKPKQYRVLSITEKDPTCFNVNALEYNSQKYIDIDNSSILVNIPVRPNPPIAPGLFLSGLFRSPNGNSICIDGGCTAIYTTNQGGVNSIMYNIRPTPNSEQNKLYYVYFKSGSNFTSVNTTEEQYLYNIISPQLLNTGVDIGNFRTGTIPPFLTPTATGNYYFRVFAENSIGERSSAATGFYSLTSQASLDRVYASGYNIY